MKLTATIARSLQADTKSELREIERAVTTGTRDARRGLRTELRRQVTSAGLGERLANAWLGYTDWRPSSCSSSCRR